MAGGNSVEPINTTYYVVSDLQIGLQTGSSRLLYATWKWNKDYTKNFKVTWKYYTGDGVWFIGNESDVDKPSGSSAVRETYSAPENALRVSCTVLPVSETYEKTTQMGNSKGYLTYNATYWKARNATVYYNFNNFEMPAKPSTPSVTIDGNYKLVASLNVSDTNTQIIEFEVVKNNTTVISSGQVKVKTQYASYQVAVAAGGEYKVRCRALRKVTMKANNDTGYNASGVKGTTGVEITGSRQEYVSSDWSDYSSNLGTVPVAPTRIKSHEVDTPTSLYLTWDQVATATEYTVEYTTSKRFFDTSSSTKSQTVTATTAYIEGLDTGTTWYFRLKAKNAQGESGWSEIYSVIMGAVPAPPTTWSETSTAIVGDMVRLYWVHNSEDGSKQEEAKIQVKIDNGDWQEYAPTYKSETQGEASYLNYNTFITITDNITDSSNNDVTDNDTNPIVGEAHIDYPEGMIIRWRVSTRGVMTTGGRENGFSEWSTERVVTMYAPPTIELTVTNTSESTMSVYTYTSFPIYVKANAFPSTQLAVGWNLSIIANNSYEAYDDVGRRTVVVAGDEVFSEYIPGGSNSVSRVLNASDVDLENEQTYTIKMTVSMNSGLRAEAQQNIETQWTSSNLWPNAEIAIDSETLCAYIRPFAVDDEGELVANTTLSVYRREYDGRFVEIDTGIDNTKETVVTDPHPSLNFARYRIVAISTDTGLIGFYDLPGERVGETGIVIQWDEEWSDFNVPSGDSDGIAETVWTGSMLKLPYNVKVSESTSIDKSLVEYIGRSAPVSYYGTQLGVSGSWSSEFPATDQDTIYALRRLQIYKGDCYVREPNGVGYWASVNVSFNKDYSSLLIPVTLDVTRVEGGI